MTTTEIGRVHVVLQGPAEHNPLDVAAWAYECTEWLVVYPGGVSWRTHENYEARVVGQGPAHGHLVHSVGPVLKGQPSAVQYIKAKAAQGRYMYLPINTPDGTAILRPHAETQSPIQHYKVIWPTGIAYRFSNYFTDINQTVQAVSCGQIVKGRTVQSADKTGTVLMLKLNHGQYLPIGNMAGQPLMQLSEAMPAPQPSPPRPPPPPPPVWQVATDPSSGRKYWYNTQTGETTWNDPNPKKSDWVPVRDPVSGKTYYFNQVTKATSWTNPDQATVPMPQPPPQGNVRPYGGPVPYRGPESVGTAAGVLSDEEQMQQAMAMSRVMY